MPPMLQTDQPSAQPDSVVRLVHGKQPAHAMGAAAWPDIDGALLDDRALAVPGFPVATLPLPWRTWIDDTARSVNAPADYVAQAVLAAVAGVCGAGVWVRVSAVWSDPLWLWLAVVGAPSSGKSPALAPVRRLLSALEKEGGAPRGVARAAPARKRRPPRIADRRIVDRGIVDRGIVDRGSVETLLEGASGNQRGVVLWRDEPAGCFAPLVAKGAAKSAIRALDPFPISILGALEPDRLAAALHRGEESLAARFLYAWPALPPFCPLADRTPARDDEALALLRAIRATAGTISEPLCLALDEAALATLDGFLAGLHAELREGEGLFAAWLGKGPGLVPRLAGVLHLLDWSANRASDPSIDVGEVGPGAVERAIALWGGYFRPHAKAFFDRVAPADLEARARRVVRWLLASGRGEVSREDVRRIALAQTVTASEADRVLARLTKAGVLRPIAPEARPQGGRPALRWEVNPALQIP
ncbi:Protein of unknown function [Rhodospirillales bacterium URHD0017]|nr:Protein of unknown function [Rhodospirillales bacterium URHD0017]